MSYNIKTFTIRGDEVVKWLEREYTSIRTGRATPILLDLILVESYGARVPIQQVGNMSVEDARTLRVSVWDQNAIKSVEKAIIEADLGVSVVVDGSGLRVIFPELTSERRTQLLKIAKSKLEEARISLRNIRDEVIKELDRMEKAGDMSQDEKFDTKEEIQKHVESFHNALGAHYDTKEKEINI